MVSEETKGNWMKFKGKIREKWGDLTDDDLDRMQGRREQFVGRLAERSGQRREEIDRDVGKIADETGYRFEQ